MLIKKKDVLRGEDIASSDITDEQAYLNRRSLIKRMAALGVTGTALATNGVQASSILEKLFGKDEDQAKNSRVLKPLKYIENPDYRLSEQMTTEQLATTYNNFYEFSYDKEEPAYISDTLKVSPWSFEVAGEAEVTGKFNLEDILAKQQLEERVYRMRCVEAWSMVIPWIGFPLAKLIEQFKPSSDAKYVEFTTLLDPKQFPNQGSMGFGSLDWPYVEGLTIEEAMNPLTLMAVGMYGKEIPSQNGAPIRLVVPWKYGFKGIKSIVKMTFTKKRPEGSWEKAAPREYGFYANVNPEVPHPRWSQAIERRLTDSSLSNMRRINTLPFNGYGEQVAHLYKDIDLKRNY